MIFAVEAALLIGVKDWDRTVATWSAAGSFIY